MYPRWILTLIQPVLGGIAFFNLSSLVSLDQLMVFTTLTLLGFSRASESIVVFILQLSYVILVFLFSFRTTR